MVSSRNRMLWLAVVLVVVQIAVGAQSAQTGPAETSASAWLSLVDTQNYGASWDQASGFFRGKISREQWSAAARGARTPFGELQKRTLKSATAATTLPGAPDGEYVVVQFTSVFEHKAAAVETVTVTHEADRAWRVVGYFIR
jgi:hypothetical protein